MSFPNSTNEALRMEIFERRKAEAALAAEKEFLDVTLQSIGDGVIITNTAGNIISFNREAEKITGWSKLEAIGRPLAELLRLLADEAKPVPCGNPLDLIVKQKGKAGLSQILVAKDGSRKAVYCRGGLIKDKQNSILGCVVVFQDITEQKAVEARLALAQKLESLGQLAAGIAHEINTPMQYIGDNTRFLQDSFHKIVQVWRQCQEVMAHSEAVPPALALEELKNINKQLDMEFYLSEVPQAIEQTLEGIERVSQIVSAMKSFSHSSPGGKKPADLNKGIENTVTVSRNEWKYVADISLDLARDLPPVECEIGAVNQAILNMIINAAQAIKEVINRRGYERGLIWIKTEALSDSVQIVIGDNGAGIDPAVIGRIFDPFFTTKEVGIGTGQGLMIAHDIIVNKHGGSIKVESAVGKGAVFTVNLPFKSLAEAPGPG